MGDVACEIPKRHQSSKGVDDSPQGDRVLQEAAKQLRGNDPTVHATWTCQLDLAYGVVVRWVRGALARSPNIDRSLGGQRSRMHFLVRRNGGLAANVSTTTSRSRAMLTN